MARCPSKWLDSIEKQKRRNNLKFFCDRQTDRQSQLLAIMTPRLGAEINKQTGTKRPHCGGGKNTNNLGEQHISPTRNSDSMRVDAKLSSIAQKILCGRNAVFERRWKWCLRCTPVTGHTVSQIKFENNLHTHRYYQVLFS